MIPLFAVPLVLDLETKSLTYLVRSTITNTIGNWDFLLAYKGISYCGVINDGLSILWEVWNKN